MKRKYLLRLILLSSILIMGVFIFRNYLLRSITKDFEKEILTHETKDFKFEMSINKSMGCAKRGIDIINDSVEIYNFRLETLLSYLTQKDINSSNIHKLFKDQKEGYNFYYFPKNTEGKLRLRTRDILNKLGEEFNFSYQFDSIEKTVYKPEIYDIIKLQEYVDNAKRTNHYRPGEKYIQFMSCNLGCIFRTFNYHIKDLIIDDQTSDSLYYSFTIPSTESDKIISYLDQKLGIRMNSEKKLIEELTIDVN